MQMAALLGRPSSSVIDRRAWRAPEHGVVHPRYLRSSHFRHLALLRRCLRSSLFRLVLLRGPSGQPCRLTSNLGFSAAAPVTTKEPVGHESCRCLRVCHNSFHDEAATHGDAQVTPSNARCQGWIGAQTRQRLAADGCHCCGSLLRTTGHSDHHAKIAKGYVAFVAITNSVTLAVATDLVAGCRYVSVQLSLASAQPVVRPAPISTRGGNGLQTGHS